MWHRATMLGRLMLFVVVALTAFLSGAWAALALYYRLPGKLRWRLFGSLLWAALVMSLATLAWATQNCWPLAAYAAIYTIILLWWVGIRPSNQRVWRDDVARVLTGQIRGDHVILDNVRNFHWRSDNDYDIRWERRAFDLGQLVRAEAVLSYWSGPAIAHAMISFGFDDGRHLVFSVEVRKRRDQKYSSIGGFFKQFETILVAADESDIIRVRTDVRHEDVYLYPLCIEKSTLRKLFTAYVTAANRLATRPAFYNTFTSNCSTLVHRMARQIDPSLPWDMRLLLTGYLPEYLYRIGMLDQTLSLDQLRQQGHITERAKFIAPNADFSRAIRQANASA